MGHILTNQTIWKYLLGMLNTNIFYKFNYSRSQNNVNVVYCNYKETHSSYNVIAKRNSPQTLLIVGNLFKIFV